MAKSKKAGSRTAQFRAQIEGRLSAIGFPKSRIVWQTAPARLLVIVGDELREFGINAGRARAAVEYEMGRLATWAEVLRLAQRDELIAPAGRIRRADLRQVDLVDMLSGAAA